MHVRVPIPQTAAMAGSTPRLSFIVPALNAAPTLERTLRSIRRQTRRDWEAVIVDDGSQDGTRAIAEAWGREDGRIRVLRRSNGGPAAARNTGLEAARAPLVTFLDADDTIRPSFMSRMLRRLAATEDADAVACGCTLRSSRGRVIERRPPGPVDRDLRTACRRMTPVAMHAAVLPRQLIRSLGGFDETLRTHEDWGLWIAIAGAGARVAREPAALADYWCRPASLTRNGIGMVRDHRPASARAGALFPDLDPVEATVEEAVSAASSVLWNVSVAIGAGADWRTVLAVGCEDGRLGTGITPASVAPAVLSGLAVGSERPVDALARSWTIWAPECERAFDQLEARTGAVGLAYGLTKACEREMLRADRWPPASRRLRRSIGVRPRLSVLLGGVAASPESDSVVLTAARFRKTVSFAAFGTVTGARLRAELARGIVDQLLWSGGGRAGGAIERLLRTMDPAVRPMARRVVTSARRWRSDAGAAGHAAADAATAVPPRAVEPFTALSARTGDGAADAIIERARAGVAAEGLTRIGPVRTSRIGDPGQSTTALWDAFFAEPDPWGYDEPYEQIKYDRTAALIPAEPIGRVIELACAEGRFTARLAPRCRHLRATDISAIALDRTRERCAPFGNLDYAVLNFFEEPFGDGWDLIVCSEVLYYMHHREQLDAFARRAAAALAPGGRLLGAHAFVLRDGADATGFDWDVPFGADVIADAYERVGGLRRERTIRTPLYRIDLFRRPLAGEGQLPPTEDTLPLGSSLTPAVARWVVPQGAVRTRAEVETERAFRVPVLMYHRVANDGPARLARYRVTPAEFERQLIFLRRRGFRSTGLDEWDRGRWRLSLSGRPILLTFDDAYEDFFTEAWPLLQRYGFTAHVFVPTDRVGGTADWDTRHGEPAPIMGWSRIAALAAAGVTFGSHLATHPASDCTPSDQLLFEAARSRATLEAVLGVEITSIAAPYGAADSRTDSVYRLAGYRHGFRDGGGPARVWQLGIATPRIEIPAGLSLDAFAAALGTPVEAPDRRDRPIEDA